MPPPRRPPWCRSSDSVSVATIKSRNTTTTTPMRRRSPTPRSSSGDAALWPRPSACSRRFGARPTPARSADEQLAPPRRDRRRPRAHRRRPSRRTKTRAGSASKRASSSASEARLLDLGGAAELRERSCRVLPAACAGKVPKCLRGSSLLLAPSVYSVAGHCANLHSLARQLRGASSTQRANIARALSRSSRRNATIPAR